MKWHFILEQLINRLKKSLNGQLPGGQAQYLMAPRHRRRVEASSLKEDEFRPSAVMILFCENDKGEMFIPLTERMTYNGAHSGQISLPGGKYEAADGDLMHTALRECFEEIGVSEIDILGKLTPLFIPVSGFLVHPYVGVSRLKNPVMVNQEREVKRLLQLRLEDLMNDAIIKRGDIALMENMSIHAPWYELEGLRVWGATAMILSELKELLRTIS